MTHTPVLVSEVLQALAPHGQDRLLDGTLGLGGHTAAYLETGGEGTSAAGIELDEQALVQAKVNLARFGSRVTFMHGSYHQVKDFSQGGEILSPMYNHILLDLGIGSHQLADEKRGFSFQTGMGLSMRYDRTGQVPAAQLDCLNKLERRLGYAPDVSGLLEFLSEQELAQVLRVYGEEKFAGRIAQALKTGRFASASAMAAAISASVPAAYRHGSIHPATRTFQALRLAVNRELEILAAALPLLLDVLAPQGKIAVISFHSLEDRLVKQFFAQLSKGCICPAEQPVCTCGQNPRLKLLTKKPMQASEEEITKNPRSRSAKMRVAQKTDS